MREDAVEEVLGKVAKKVREEVVEVVLPLPPLPEVVEEIVDRGGGTGGVVEGTP